jgi:hypothetical protein
MAGIMTASGRSSESRVRAGRHGARILCIVLVLSAACSVGNVTIGKTMAQIEKERFEWKPGQPRPMILDREDGTTETRNFELISDVFGRRRVAVCLEELLALAVLFASAVGTRRRWLLASKSPGDRSMKAEKHLAP